MAKQVFVSVIETIVGSLLGFVVGIVCCLFNLVCYTIILVIVPICKLPANFH